MSTGGYCGLLAELDAASDSLASMASVGGFLRFRVTTVIVSDDTDSFTSISIIVVSCDSIQTVTASYISSSAL